MAEKTEKATPKKLRDARKKGQVAKSQDFPSSITFMVSIATTLFLAHHLYQKLGSYMIETFMAISHNPDMMRKASGFLQNAIMNILECSFPIMIITALIGCLTSFILVGPVFSSHVLKPDIKRLNPVTNIKNLLKFKTIFELLKSLLKIIGACIIIYFVIRDSLQQIVATAGLPVLAIAMVFSSFLKKVIIQVGVFFLIVATIDLIFQRRTFAKEMKMEKFEVKQEFRDTEGDPHIKSRRRQQAQELAYQEGPRGVRNSRAVITNPVHIAVAIDYKPKIDPSPRIITMGKGIVADTMIKIAVEYNVPIMRNVELAQLLYAKGAINQYIPQETYQAVAEILRWLEKIEVTKEVHPELLQ
jgi:type III secretion protein U